MLETDSLSARDAIHIAVMEAHDVDRISTIDAGFDAVDTLQRIY